MVVMAALPSSPLALGYVIGICIAVGIVVLAAATPIYRRHQGPPELPLDSGRGASPRPDRVDDGRAKLWHEETRPMSNGLAPRDPGPSTGFLAAHRGLGSVGLY
jgi:hypothetical protein